MRSVKNDSKRRAITFDSLDKKELHDVCGGGTFYWCSKTKTLYYVS